LWRNLADWRWWYSLTRLCSVVVPGNSHFCWRNRSPIRRPRIRIRIRSARGRSRRLGSFCSCNRELLDFLAALNRKVDLLPRAAPGAG
jgi:hypothetical protein